MSFVILFQILKILEGFPLPLASSGPLGVHRTIEAMKHAFAMRMGIGDPNFVDTKGLIEGGHEGYLGSSVTTNGYLLSSLDTV